MNETERASERRAGGVRGKTRHTTRKLSATERARLAAILSDEAGAQLDLPLGRAALAENRPGQNDTGLEQTPRKVAYLASDEYLSWSNGQRAAASRAGLVPVNWGE